MSDAKYVVLLVFGILLLFFSFIYIVTNAPQDYISSCRYSCDSLQRAANNKCGDFDIQKCFNDCLELMNE